MTSCEVVLAYSHLANNKSKRKHTHFEQHTNFYIKLQMPYLLLIYKFNVPIVQFEKNPLKSRLALDELLPSACPLVS